MAAQTIIQMRASRTEIRELINKFPIKNYIKQEFGAESEYSAQGVLSGLEGLLTDISTLTGASNQFIKASTYAERNQINGILSRLSSNLQNENLAQVATEIDTLKPIIRNYGTRYTEERYIAFMDNVDEIQKKSSISSRNLEEAIKLYESSKEIFEKIEENNTSLEEKMEELLVKLAEAETLLNNADTNSIQINEFMESASETVEQIDNHLSQAKSHEELISNFSQRVEKRESQLEKQEQTTDSYNESLLNYQSSHDEILNKSTGLIDSAKKALNYKTAEGLSIAFTEKYNELKADKSTTKWIFGASIFFSVAVAIGIWILLGKEISTGTILGRISLIPLLLGGAWFCAGQYIKLKNLAEDYAYKSVLVKSIVGFSEQISSKASDGDEYSYYMKAVLNEIHSYPLKRKDIKEKPDTDIRGDIKLIFSEIKKITESKKT